MKNQQKSLGGWDAATNLLVSTHDLDKSSQLSASIRSTLERVFTVRRTQGALLDRRIRTRRPRHVLRHLAAELPEVRQVTARVLRPRVSRLTTINFR